MLSPSRTTKHPSLSVIHRHTYQYILHPPNIRKFFFSLQGPNILKRAPSHISHSTWNRQYRQLSHSSEYSAYNAAPTSKDYVTRHLLLSNRGSCGICLSTATCSMYLVIGSISSSRTPVKPFSFPPISLSLSSPPYSSQPNYPPYSSVCSHSLKLFCRCLEFQFNILEILFTHSSLPRPCGCTFANGYRDAEIVT